jgi:hypothetical protein
MKKDLILVLLLLLWVVPVTAQDSTPAACDADSINAAVDRLITAYAAAKGQATDSASALQAAQDLQDGIASLTSGCAGVTPVTTPEAVASSAGGIAALTQGKWMLHWSFASQTCPGTNVVSTANDRPLIITVDTNKNSIVLDDIFNLGKAEFSGNADGTYEFLRSNAGASHSIDYVLSMGQPPIITRDWIVIFRTRSNLSWWTPISSAWWAANRARICAPAPAQNLIGSAVWMPTNPLMSSDRRRAMMALSGGNCRTGDGYARMWSRKRVTAPACRKRLPKTETGRQDRPYDYF